MNSLLMEAITIYGITDYDWLSFKITNDNPLTNHHIKKEEHGGRRIISNSAPLTKLGHRYLHDIEHTDIDTYNKLNAIFKAINESGTKASSQHLQIIRHILYEFEREHEAELKHRIKHMRLNIPAIRTVMHRKDLSNPTNFRLVMQMGVDPVIHGKQKRVKSKRKKFKKISKKC